MLIWDLLHPSQSWNCSGVASRAVLDRCFFLGSLSAFDCGMGSLPEVGAWQSRVHIM